MLETTSGPQFGAIFLGFNGSILPLCWLDKSSGRVELNGHNFIEQFKLICVVDSNLQEMKYRGKFIRSCAQLRVFTFSLFYIGKLTFLKFLKSVLEQIGSLVIMSKTA